MAPFGLREQKPHHYREMLRVTWENRDQLPFAWRILRDGVCDGCALGTSGLRDWTLPGTHLCMVRLELMRLNTAPALDTRVLTDAASLKRCSSADLRALGRLPQPLLRRSGEPGFLEATWDEALDRMAAEVRAVDPNRAAFYLTSRGITNETYYAVQKAARFLGTHHVDNSARLCHAASTAAMTAMLGYGASTCSYTDWLDASLIVLFGSNIANNQPVAVKYLEEAKRRGARVLVVNPCFEPGLQRYWIPSRLRSALFGTAIADEWIPIQTGGDLAFLLGTFRALVERGAVDAAFIDRHTTGYAQARDAALGVEWDAIEHRSGLPRKAIERFAGVLIDRPDAVFIWSMGLTQHRHGVDTIRALINVGLARGLPGRENRGLVPIRGHSGVQGGAEVGCAPMVSDATAAHWSAVWDFPVRPGRGWTATEMIEHAAAGDVDLFWMVGGNFLETVADAAQSLRALARPRLRVHHDIVLTTAMLAPSDGDVLVLPATTRYESVGGGTETSTERRIIFSPEVPGRRIAGARPEWHVLGEVMARAWPDRAPRAGFVSAADIRAEIARAVPLYDGIERLATKGDAFQWGGRTLYENGIFATSDGRAHFATVALPLDAGPDRVTTFVVSTRRGKQFNSMVQREVDPLTGAGRDAVFICQTDLDRLGLTPGARVRLTSLNGGFTGR
ncbi:MAG: molybdopterin-dependent oxidoreductase, partial [Vicinamibacterales bacterium]